MISLKYRKIPKISPGAYVFSKALFEGAHFWRGLYSEGLMYGGKFCVSKSIGLACSGKEIYHFCFLYKPPGGLMFGGAI